MVRESGAIPPKVEHEIGASIGQLNEAASLISIPLEQELTSAIPGRSSSARRAPIGVVGVITPWNFPIVLAMRSLGPALVLGNAVVLKSDPNTPVSGGVIIARIFEEAGLPSGVLHVLLRRSRDRAGAGRGPERPHDLVHRLDQDGPCGR